MNGSDTFQSKSLPNYKNYLECFFTQDPNGEWNYKIVPRKKTVKRVYTEKISWKSMENADGYCIYLKSFPSGKMSKVKTIKGTGNSTFIKKMNSGKMDGKYQGYHEYYICGYMRTLQGKNEYSKFVKVPINNVEE